MKERRERSEASAAQFDKAVCRDDEFKRATAGFLTFDNEKCILEIDDLHLDNHRSSWHIRLLRSFYTLKQHRSQGIFTRCAKRLVNLSDRSGCLLCAVSNPFELLDFDDPQNETIEEAIYNMNSYARFEYAEDADRKLMQAQEQRLAKLGLQT